MTSPAATTTPRNDLAAQLSQIGLKAIPQNLDDFIARATKGRWSPGVLLEQLAQEEAHERSRRSLEHGCRASSASNRWPTSTGVGRRRSNAASSSAPSRSAARLRQSRPPLHRRSWLLDLPWSGTKSFPTPPVSPRSWTACCIMPT